MSEAIADTEEPTAPNVLQFPRGDMENFSVARASLAKAQAKRGNRYAWAKDAPWEKAYLDAEAKAMGDQVSGVDGGYLAPEVWSDQWFGLLRNFSAIDQLPIKRYAVPARVTRIPKVTGDVTVTYSGENTALTATQYKLGGVQFAPRKSSALIYVSNEMIRDAGDLADVLLRDQSAQALAIDRDNQLVNGGTGGTPAGLLNSPAIQTWYFTAATGVALTKTLGSAFAASPSYIGVGAFIGAIETLNASTAVTAGQVKCSGMLVHSQFRQTVIASANFQDSQKRPMWFQDLNTAGGMFGMKWSLSNLIPTTANVGSGASNNTSYIIGGAWEKYALMEWGGIEYDATIEAGSSTTGFQADQTSIKVTYRYDGAPVQPEAFGILSGVLV